MPFLRVRLWGKGVSYPFEGSPDPVVGFFTTRAVRAETRQAAEEKALAVVLREWLPPGPYASHNEGPVPELVVEESWQVGFFEGVLGRKPSGYSFYTHED